MSQSDQSSHRDTGKSTPEVSFVIPCYNEEANIVQMYEAVTEQAKRHSLSYEIIFIDNDSTDSTAALARGLCERDPSVRAILNNRNYGQMRSPTYAIYQAEGEAVIAMCCDFQDPPSLIGEFISQWRAGAQIALGQRRTERTSWLLGATRKVGYALLKRLADNPIISGVTGFGLYSREVVDMFASWNEPEPFIRGMALESGYRCVVIPYDRPERQAGTSANSFWTLLNFALSGLSGSAKSLLRLPLLLSVSSFVFTVILAIFSIGWCILVGFSPLLMLSTALFVMFSVLLLFIGLLGDQLRLLVERSRNVPLVIERERINFPAERSLPAQRTIHRAHLDGRA